MNPRFPSSRPVSGPAAAHRFELRFPPSRSADAHDGHPGPSPWSGLLAWWKVVTARIGPARRPARPAARASAGRLPARGPIE